MHAQCTVKELTIMQRIQNSLEQLETGLDIFILELYFDPGTSINLRSKSERLKSSRYYSEVEGGTGLYLL